MADNAQKTQRNREVRGKEGGREGAREGGREGQKVGGGIGNRTDSDS